MLVKILVQLNLIKLYSLYKHYKQIKIKINNKINNNNYKKYLVDFHKTK